jgi:hypothetical protein
MIMDGEEGFLGAFHKSFHLRNIIFINLFSYDAYGLDLQKIT